MSLVVLCDKNYQNSVWCQIKLKGIFDEAVRRRIQPHFITEIGQFETLAKTLDADSSVIVLFDSLSYIKKLSASLKQYRIHPILLVNHITIPLDFHYSLVGGDIDGATAKMAAYLRQEKKYRIAAVGMGKNSCNDSNRIEFLEKYFPKETCRFFFADGSFRECYADFAAVQNEFDAVICPNAHTAICLSEFLKNYPRREEKLFILSNTDTIMAKLYENGITSVTTNFYNCGRAAVENHFNRLKFGWAYSKIYLPLELKVRGSTSADVACPNDAGAKNEHGFDMFVSELGRIENILTVSDLANLKLIYGLICDYSYEKMGEFCFLSADAAKYRVRKMKLALGADTKEQVAERLRRYIKRENILAAIGEYEKRDMICML